jgi:hypothetical protein
LSSNQGKLNCNGGVERKTVRVKRGKKNVKTEDILKMMKMGVLD